MINYQGLGKKKRLHDIVIAGTHDAAITKGGSNVQTQNLNIGEQAMAGVRFFDIRIAAAVTSEKHASGKPVAELRAFHADDSVVKKLERKVILKAPGMGSTPVKLTQSKLAGGAFGLSLTSVLQQARNFVSSDVGKSEFLILKFDKCTNWQLIAEACQFTLGMSLYTGTGNLNTKTLEDLAGKVIVLFPSSAVRDLTGDKKGILAFANLSSGNNYSNSFQGLQYYGKGGTSPFNPRNKLKQNIKKQAKLLQNAAALRQPEVIGMMYWTTTGLSESIEKRDKGMWKAPNIVKMKNLWAQGLGTYVDDRVTLPANNPLSNAQLRRNFFPNIVMIDFADQYRCQEIFDLNFVTANQLAEID